MSIAFLYGGTGLLIAISGFFGLIVCKHLLRKVLALNLMGTGIFITFIALASRSPLGDPDTVPHAMVLTGIVVAVSATALVLAMIVRLHAATRKISFEEIKHDLKGSS